MEKLIKVLSDGDTFDKFVEILVNRAKDNENISDNPMLDGMIISMIVLNAHLLKKMFNGEDNGRLLDGTIQQLEHSVTWINNNEEFLYNLIVK